MKRHIHYLYDVEIDYNWRVGNYNKALSVLDERETELRKKNNLTTLMALIFIFSRKKNIYPPT